MERVEQNGQLEYRKGQAVGARTASVARQRGKAALKVTSCHRALSDEHPAGPLRSSSR